MVSGICELRKGNGDFAPENGKCRSEILVSQKAINPDIGSVKKGSKG